MQDSKQTSFEQLFTRVYNPMDHMKHGPHYHFLSVEELEHAYLAAMYAGSRDIFAV